MRWVSDFHTKGVYVGVFCGGGSESIFEEEVGQVYGIFSYIGSYTNI